VMAMMLVCLCPSATEAAMPSLALRTGRLPAAHTAVLTSSEDEPLLHSRWRGLGARGVPGIKVGRHKLSRTVERE
jgi:hypothetical protein